MIIHCKTFSLFCPFFSETYQCEFCDLPNTVRARLMPRWNVVGDFCWALGFLLFHESEFSRFSFKIFSRDESFTICWWCCKVVKNKIIIKCAEVKINTVNFLWTTFWNSLFFSKIFNDNSIRKTWMKLSIFSLKKNETIRLTHGSQLLLHFHWSSWTFGIPLKSSSGIQKAFPKLSLQSFFLEFHFIFIYFSLNTGLKMYVSSLLLSHIICSSGIQHLIWDLEP